ncbi:MAG: DUF1801 domain-containing protein [Bacteroidota bacterium]
MNFEKENKFHSIVEFWESLPENEAEIVDVLRQIVLQNLPDSCEEKMTNNVPYYFGKKRICLIWPASIKGGGIKKGVLFGFSKGNLLKDKNNYLDHGTNKRIFYKIFLSVDEINEKEIVLLLKGAVKTDNSFKK